jgi:hypothetical protein
MRVYQQADHYASLSKPIDQWVNYATKQYPVQIHILNLPSEKLGDPQKCGIKNISC